MPASSTTWLLRTTSGLCLTLLALVALPAVAQAVAPPNDAFADAQVVRVGDRATGTLAAATLEAGEPATSSPQIVGSVRPGDDDDRAGTGRHVRALQQLGAGGLHR